ncbi:hypothetical protein GCM10010319_34440 [Streptomyces blastmyceticus]|uniref:Uncharacterized protein n=1 Tax=Streptomyces blastmyceticus TaxID=68180 RepID=A0ABP3GW69_9ACTN
MDTGTPGGKRVVRKHREGAGASGTRGRRNAAIGAGEVGRDKRRATSKAVGNAARLSRWAWLDHCTAGCEWNTRFSIVA